MKFTIEGFNQEYATTLKKVVERKGKETMIQIDCTDLVILRWFVDFYPKMKKCTIDGKEYGWLTHNKLMEDLPLINISRQSFIERMQKLVEFDILTYQFVKENGNQSVYGFGENYTYLVDNTRVIGSNQQGLLGQTNNNKSIITNQLKSNKYKREIEQIIDYLNLVLNTRYTTKSSKTCSLVSARLNEGYSIEDFKLVIDQKFKDWNNTDYSKYLRPETLFSPKFEGYLNSAIRNKPKPKVECSEERKGIFDLNSR